MGVMFRGHSASTNYLGSVSSTMFNQTILFNMVLVVALLNILFNQNELLCLSKNLEPELIRAVAMVYKIGSSKMIPGT